MLQNTNQKNENYIFPVSEYFKLSDKFLEPYKTKEVNWGPLGYVVYKRSYARELKEGNKTEEWWQTVKRVVEGLYTVQLNHCKHLRLPWNKNKATRSAQIMYDKIFTFKMLPSGRGLYNMGTDLIYKRGSMSLFSCAGVSTKDIDYEFSDPFAFMMDVSMCGVGCGFNTEGANKVKIKQPKIGDYTFVVEDSKEGWIELVRVLLDSYVGKAVYPKSIDYSKIRPVGEPIITSGGKAPGADPLVKCIEDLNKVLTNKIDQYITSGDIVDIMNLIGRCVVSGGKRRCLPINTEVHTLNGLVKIQDIKEGTLVRTSDGFKKVTEVIYQGKQNLITVKTNSGDIKATSEHRLKVFTDLNTFEWKKIKDLQKDDELVFLRQNDNESIFIPIKVLDIIDENIIEETYDISVEDNHEFVFNQGFVSHNSAQLALGDSDDEEYMNLKNPDINAEKMTGWRWNSNNSIYAKEGMNYTNIVDQIKKSGEPGLVYLDKLQHYGRIKDGYGLHDIDSILVNPCAELYGESHFLCNLVETFPKNHETYEEYKSTLKFAYLYAKTCTIIPTHIERANQVLFKTRRIGISQSGIIQAIEKHGLRTYLNWCDEGYKYLRHIDEIYSGWLTIPKSIKVTTCKPAGCVTDDTITVTDKGIFTIRDIFENFEKEKIDKNWDELKSNLNVIQDTENKKISKLYKNGRSKIIKIKMRYGLNIECTPEHKFFLKESHRGSGNGSMYINDWVKASDLKPTDVLDVNINSYNNETHYKFKKVFNSSKFLPNSHIIIQPDEMNEDLAWLLGYLWGDRSLSKSKSRIRFIDFNLFNLEKVQRILKTHFNIECKINKVSKKEAYVIEVGSVWLWSFFTENSIVKYIDEKHSIADIPLCVRSSSKSDIISFISGMIDSDGCVHKDKRKNEISVILTNGFNRFSKHIQNVALNVGLVFGRSHNTKGKNKQNIKNILLMRLTQSTDKESFNILYRNSEKMKKFKLSNKWNTVKDEKNKCVLGKIVSIEYTDKEKETYDLEVEDNHWYYANGIKSHNSTSLLLGSTPGVHFPHSQYYIRRIKIPNTNPEMIQALSDAGYNHEETVYNDNCEVFEFPVKEENFRRSKYDVSMMEQLELGAKIQYYWSDHSVSQTITVKPEEFDNLKYALELYEDRLKTVSFLPLQDHNYAQAPYEEITKEEYEKRASKLKPIVFDNVTKEDGEDDKFCSSETCEIKLFTTKNED